MAGARAATWLLFATASATGSSSPAEVCSECSSPESQALWWRKTGLNCPPGPQGHCDICVTTAQQHLCDAAKTEAACCEVCTKWNSGALPGESSGKHCDVWYWNGAQCLLKEGGGETKEPYAPVAGDSMVSGPGCRTESAWGWTTVIVLAVAATLYVGGGVGWSVQTQGAAPGLSAHPHLALWRQGAGLVVDGAIFARASAQARLQGQPPPATGGTKPAAAGSAAGGGQGQGEKGDETEVLLAGGAESSAEDGYGATAGSAGVPAADKVTAAAGGEGSSSESDDDVVE